MSSPRYLKDVPLGFLFYIYYENVMKSLSHFWGQVYGDNLNRYPQAIVTRDWLKSKLVLPCEVKAIPTLFLGFIFISCKDLETVGSLAC